MTTGLSRRGTTTTTSSSSSSSSVLKCIGDRHGGGHRPRCLNGDAPLAFELVAIDAVAVPRPHEVHRSGASVHRHQQLCDEQRQLAEHVATHYLRSQVDDFDVCEPLAVAKCLVDGLCGYACLGVGVNFGNRALK